MNIHPTAIVSPNARIGENTTIGAYSILGDEVSLGDNCVVEEHVILRGTVHAGSGNSFSSGTVIGSRPQDFSQKGDVFSDVRIGDNNVFREHTTVHRGTQEGSSTVVGNNNFFMVGVHLGHNVTVGDRNVIANNCLLAGYVNIGDDVVLGGGAVFHQFLRVGNMCMVRGGTAWSKDIPPFTIGEIINSVCGLNTVGMRRKGVSKESRAEIKLLYQMFYRSGWNVSQAIQKAQERQWGEHASIFLDFVSTRSKRGLCNAERSVRQGAIAPEAVESPEQEPKAAFASDKLFD